MSHFQEEIVRQRTNGGPVGPVDASTNKFCHYCGNDILTRDRVLLQGNEEYHEQCLREHIPWVNEAVKEFSEFEFNEHVLSMAIHVTVVYGSKGPDRNKKKKRDSKANEFLKNVSALRNSNSGFLLIHLVGLDTNDTFTGAFDEFADVKLQGLISDGRLFTDVYRKQRLSQREGLDKYTDILVLYVEGSESLITSDFKTKQTLDDCVIDIQDSTLTSFIRKKKTFKVKFHALTAQHAEDLCGLHKSRHIQTKAYFQPKTRDDKLVADIFERFKLSEYISAFSKLDDGGSYLLGLVEKENESFDYQSKILTVKPVVIDDCQTVDELITNRVCESCLVCNYDGKVNTDEKLVKIYFIPSNDNTGFVIHVSVKPVSGVVFYDKEGPVAYKINPKTHSVVRLTVKEWFSAFRKRFD